MQISLANHQDTRVGSLAGHVQTLTAHSRLLRCQAHAAPVTHSGAGGGKYAPDIHSLFRVVFTKMTCVSIVLLVMLLRSTQATPVCTPGTQYPSNTICATCPDATMAALGQNTCPFTAYHQSIVGSQKTFVHSLVGVKEILVDGFGSKGGDAMLVSASIGGNGGYISAKLPVGNIDSVVVVMGPAPDLRTLLFPPKYVELSVRHVMSCRVVKPALILTITLMLTYRNDSPQHNTYPSSHSSNRKSELSYTGRR